jgi:short-subunit dehydrogenase
MELRDKVVLVTGASMGIGEAIARAFSGAGAKTVLAARSLGRLEAIARNLPTDSLLLQVDMARPDQVLAMVSRTAEHFGRVDILVNNAAVGMYAAAADMSPEKLETLVRTNWLGPVYAVQAVIPYMRKQGGGQIINISSVAGKVAFPWMGAYCASKFALNAFSDSLRMEVRQDHIHVLTVCPGRVRTAFTENAFKDGATSPLFPGGISAERVARAVLRASSRNRREIVVPADNRLLGWLHSIFPSSVDYLMTCVLRPRMRRV